jgi:hypothetical protein
MLLAILALLGLAAAAPLTPTQLRVEYMKNPLGVDAPAPRFSWALEHTDRGQVRQGLCGDAESHWQHATATG